MKKRIPGIIAAIVELIILAAFVIFLASTKMIPNELLILASFGVLIITGIIFALTMNFKKKLPFVIGAVLVVLTAICCLVGGSYLKKGINTLTEITKPDDEGIGMAVYVRSSDAAEALEDTQGYTYGILETLDRENTDAALEQVEGVIGTV